MESANFNFWLGLERGSAPNEVVLETRPEHQVAPELIHFAVLSTLAEVAAATAVGVPVVPTTLQINLLRRATPGRLIGKGTVVKHGRTLAVAEGEVFKDGRLVAKATVTFAVMG